MSTNSRMAATALPRWWSMMWTPTATTTSFVVSMPTATAWRATSVMVIETEDAWAVFPGLASGALKDYCFGIRDITPKANDTAGTYIRRPTPSSTPTAPIFVAMLGRSA